MKSQESVGLEVPSRADPESPEPVRARRLGGRREARQPVPEQTPEQPPKLPEALEFSPGQVDLEVVLRIINDHAEHRDAQVEAIRQRYFASAGQRQPTEAGRLKQQRTRSYNVLVGMKGYGLVAFDTNRLTPVGAALLAEPNETQRSRAFATHILKHTHGIEVLRAIRNLRARGVKVKKLSLVDELRREGFSTLPRATLYHMTVLAWLRTAGVLTGRYDIDDAKVGDLAGVSLAQVDEWEGLTRRQQAFLQTLRRLADAHRGDSIPVREVVAGAVFEHGTVFREDQLRADVTRPLEDSDWIKSSGIGPGRGGKSGNVAATRKLLEADFERLTGYTQGEVPHDIKAKLNTPLEEIYADLRSEEGGVKGIALEVLAVRLAVDLGLVPLRFRLRSAKTGGAEVDLLAEGAHLHFSRWLFQCKNQKSAVALSDLAKEVGMATLLRGHIVVMATTGKFAGSVVQYAEELAATSPLQVILIDGATLRSYATSGAAGLQAVFHLRAQETMRLKRRQVLESIEDAEEP